MTSLEPVSVPQLSRSKINDRLLLAGLCLTAIGATRSEAVYPTH